MVDEKDPKYIDVGNEVIDMSVDVYIPNSEPRRVFYVDVGNLPKRKADDYMKKLIQIYRNK